MQGQPMMSKDSRHLTFPTLALLFAVVGLLTASTTFAQRLPGTENGEWRYLGGDAGHTRSSSLDQINGNNFDDLEVQWIWRSDNFGPNIDYFSRSTPIYADGIVYTVASTRRQVVAIDPATGETLWTFREPETIRQLRSPRQAYGKGVAYAEVNGRGVIYITSPAFFLWALDAKTGYPLENWGTNVPLDGFGGTGVNDLIPPLVSDWGRWIDRGPSYDPNYGIPRELGMVTSSAPPIVVNGVVVVLVGHQPSYGQTRIENVPGDIMGFDAATGDFLWKFHGNGPGICRHGHRHPLTQTSASCTLSPTLPRFRATQDIAPVTICSGAAFSPWMLKPENAVGIIKFTEATNGIMIFQPRRC